MGLSCNRLIYEFYLKKGRLNYKRYAHIFVPDSSFTEVWNVSLKMIGIEIGTTVPLISSNVYISEWRSFLFFPSQFLIWPKIDPATLNANPHLLSKWPAVRWLFKNEEIGAYDIRWIEIFRGEMLVMEFKIPNWIKASADLFGAEEKHWRFKGTQLRINGQQIRGLI